MGMYRCVECDNLKDNDWNVGQEWEDGLICEDCAAEHSCSWCGELEEYSHKLKNGVHHHCRLEARDEYREQCMRDERAEA